MNELIELKNRLYDLLDTNEDEAGDSIIQKLNVSMTAAIQKQGVTIIPIQNAVQKRIVVKVINILKQVDKMLEGPQVVKKEVLDLSALCEEWADKKIALQDVIEEIKLAYLMTLDRNCKSRSEAMHIAKIQPQTFYKHMKKLKERTNKSADES